MSTIISPARETKVLFNHHAARLIKTIPPPGPPQRINGHVPRDHLGPGHVYSAENETVGTVLQDWQGRLQLCAVPDIVPLGGAGNDSHGGNLVLTIEQPYNALAQVYGAQRRQVLPFRSYAITVSGDGAADAMPENTVPRTTFVGLGAGQKGQYGGSFWFFEDVSEPGAETRYRAEMAGRGKRAIWTAWLFDASPELVADLRNVLARFPLVTTSSSKAASTSPPPPAPKPTELRSPTKARRPLPVTPSAKKTDDDGEAGIPQRTPLGDITNLVGREQQAPAIPHKPEELRSIEPALAATAAAASPPTPSSNLPPPTPPASLRHSLVAVDDSTGAILAIVAHDVELSTSTASTSSEVTPKPSSIMRPANVYRDHARTPSRKGSQLGADTFAPPPIPEKDAVEPVRDSMASANFFSAQEDVSSEGEEEEDGEADEVRAGGEDEVPDGFTSLTRKAAKHGIQSHRPDLLRDVAANDDDEDDDGAASDASGSTIGGPAVQLWRKARGGKAGEKKRAAKKAAKEEKKRAEAEAAKEAAEAVALAKREQAAAAAAAAAELEEKQKREMASRSPASSANRVSTATLEDLDPQELPASPSKEQSDETRKLLLHGHVPRALMCTEDVVSAEDRIWREAIEAGHLPIDGAYTHLVAMPEATAEDEEKDDLFRKDDPAARDAQEIRLPPRGYLQGGTVLIEFLAGGSRIGASLLGVGEADEVADTDDAVPATKDTPAKAAGVTGGVLSLIPAIPSHFLAYFTETASSSLPLSPTWQKAESLAHGSRNLVTSSVSSAMSGLSGLTSFALAAPSALLSWFAMPAEPAIKSTAVDEEEDGEDEWELAIPDFDPTSLASTPRPVYRRKRPAPSFQAGFNVRQGSGSGGAKDEVPIPSSFSRRTGQQAMRDAKQQQQQPQRYSIIHFDGDGVGRRAFFKGGGGKGAVGHSPYTGPLGPL